tara:strand:+ start:13982 stop:14560 length:579 start_codon:yes stop_codon:yes gene_type:complete
MILRIPGLKNNVYGSLTRLLDAAHVIQVDGMVIEMEHGFLIYSTEDGDWKMEPTSLAEIRETNVEMIREMNRQDDTISELQDSLFEERRKVSERDIALERDSGYIQRLQGDRRRVEKELLAINEERDLVYKDYVLLMAVDDTKTKELGRLQDKVKLLDSQMTHWKTAWRKADNRADNLYSELCKEADLNLSE